MVSATDTEVIPHLLSQFTKAVPLHERLMSVGSRLAGSNSFVVMDTHTHELGAACFGSPLLLGQGENCGWVVSDILAFNKDVAHYFPLISGQVAVFTLAEWKLLPSSLIQWIATPPLTKQSAIRSSGHMMQQELLEAPNVVRRSAQVVLDHVQTELTHAPTIWVTGAGTAYHAALLGAFWLRKNQKIAWAFPASEGDSFTAIMKPGDLLILISQSGETRDTLSVLRAITGRGIQTVALVNREHSSITREVDHVIITPAGPERAVLATKSLVAQLSLLWRMIHSHAFDADSLSESLSRMLQDQSFKNSVDQVVKLFTSSKWAAVIGEGSGWPLALETALKLKEGAYVPIEGMSGGELKHGTLALVESGTICLVVDVDTDRRASLIQHATEIKARGGIIVGISPFLHTLFDYWIPISDCGNLSLFSGLTAVQYLTYRVAKFRGINPDRPRNLAKSVTVE
jgi:glucosamine--fructose-6-phosphate aminotransferase (isomerizing)